MNEWILGQPVATQAVYEWVGGQPHVVIDATAEEPPVGGAGIMTTNTGFWGATY